jgi:Restriction endonuclease S subunits
VRLLQIRDFEGDSHETYIKDAAKWRKCKSSDTLIGRYGAAVGRICRGLEGAYNVALAKVVPSERVDANYLHYLLRSSFFQLPLIAASGRSAQAGFNKGDLAVIKLPVVPLKDQIGIGRVLGSLDDKIELNRRMNETLEAMAQAIFRDWFVDFGPTRRKLEGATDPVTIMGGLITDPTRAQELADLFPATLGDDGLPEGWREGCLGDIARSVGTAVKPSEVDPSTPYIGLEHMPRRSLSLWDWEAASKVTSNKSGFNKGQILFGKLRPYFHKVGVAPVDGVCSTDIIVLDAVTKAQLSMVATCVSSDAFVAFTDQGSTGTKMPRTSWSSMKGYPLALPTADLTTQFSEFVSPMLEKVVAAVHENKTLAATRDLLLPKLMSGEIRLGEAEELVEAAQ